MGKVVYWTTIAAIVVGEHTNQRKCLSDYRVSWQFSKHVAQNTQNTHHKHR